MIFNKYKRISPKKFLETLSLFFQPEFSEKEKVLPKLDRSSDITGYWKGKCII